MATGYSDTPILPAMLVTIHSPDDRPAIAVPPSASTLDGFRAWATSDDFPERGRITFVAGEVIVDMSPESIDRHNFLKAEISSVLYQYVRQNRMGKFYADGVLISNEQAGVSNEPDASFVSYESIRSSRVAFPPLKGDPQAGMEIVGTVDWVLEVVSISSVKKDTVLLRKAYFDAGIPEYWLIDALDDVIDFQMLVRGNGEYIPVAAKDGWLASPTFGKSFRLERTFDDLQILEYTLHMK
jgi:Uma2 family endonuclease